MRGWAAWKWVQIRWPSQRDHFPSSKEEIEGERKWGDKMLLRNGCFFFFVSWSFCRNSRLIFFATLVSNMNPFSLETTKLSGRWSPFSFRFKWKERKRVEKGNCFCNKEENSLIFYHQVLCLPSSILLPKNLLWNLFCCEGRGPICVFYHPPSKWFFSKKSWKWKIHSERFPEWKQFAGMKM